MAKKIIHGIGKLFPLGGVGVASKAAKSKDAATAAAPAAEQKGPIIKQLGGALGALDPRKRRKPVLGGAGSILNDTLGG